MEQQTQNGAPRIAEEAEDVQQQASEAQQPQDASSVFQAQEQQREEQQIDHSVLTGAVRTIQTKMDNIVEQIKSDRRLDRTEIHHRIRETWHRASGVHAELMQVYERQLEEDSAEREQSLFRVAPNMRDSVRSAYNDVYDRTAPGFQSGDSEGFEYAREELERLWERAIRTGDRALETAIGQLAMERGDVQLRDAYLSRSKEKTGQWERYVQARQKLESFRDPRQRFYGSLTQGWALGKPPEA